LVVGFLFKVIFLTQDARILSLKGSFSIRDTQVQCRGLDCIDDRTRVAERW